MTFKVQMVSMGGTRKDLYTGLTEHEAVEICESYGWVMDEGYLWDLDIVEDDEQEDEDDEV